MEVVQNLDPSVWREFVDQHPQANVFHTPELFEVFARTQGHCPRLWAVVDHKKVLALLPIVSIQIGGRLGQYLPSRHVAYGSLLAAPGASTCEGLELLFRVYRKQLDPRVLFTELRNHVSQAEWKPTLETIGFEYEPHLNYLIELTLPTSEIFGAIGARTRKHIRRAQRAKRVEVSEVFTRSELSAWYALLELTYARAGVPLADISCFETAFHILRPRGMCKFWIAHIEGSPAACSVELLYRDQMYGWYGGTDRRWSAETPNELLTWHILEWGAQNGYRVYDFGGAGRPAEAYGVRDFKAKFGGALVEYGRFIWVHSPRAMQFGKLAYQHLGRRIFGRRRNAG